MGPTIRRQWKKYREDSMYLWNPITNESEEISLPFGGRPTYVHVNSCWFGFIPSSDDYKILLVYTAYKPYREECMDLYSLRNNRWREIHVSDENLCYISLSESVFMDEALHYLVRNQCILKFDLVTEAFERIPFSIKPELFPNVDQMWLGVLGEFDCLCVMFVRHSKKDVGNFGVNLEELFNEDSDIGSEEDFGGGSDEDYVEDSEEDSSDDSQNWMFELWILEEYNKWDSWKKWYGIHLDKDIAIYCSQFIGLTYSGILCIRAINDGLVVVDPSDDPPSHVFVRHYSAKVYKMINYVESLVSPCSLSD